MSLKRVLVVSLLFACAGCNGSMADPVPQLEPSAPHAVSAGDIDVDEGDVVELDGSLSWDPDNDIRSFAWAQISGIDVTPPAGDLAGTDKVIATFTAPQVGSQQALTFRLTATDQSGLSDSTRVTVNVEDLNLAPNIVMPAPISIDARTTITVDAFTHDDGGSVATWAWRQQPGSPSGTLVNSDREDVDFTAPDVDQRLEVVLRLTVTDNEGKVSAADVSIFVDPVVTQIGFADRSVETDALRNVGWRPLIVEVQNFSGDRVRTGPDSTPEITVSVQAGTGSATGTLSGTLTLLAVAGAATFADLAYDEVTPANNGVVIEAVTASGMFGPVSTIPIEITWPSRIPGGLTAASQMRVNAMTTIGSGNDADVLLAGRFQGAAVDFALRLDPAGGGAAPIDSNGIDGFVARYDGRGGELEWVQVYTSAATVAAVDVAASSLNEIFVAVSYDSLPIDFATDPTTGGAPITAPSFGNVDVAVAKLTGDGWAEWVSALGGPNDDNPRGLAIDSQNNCTVVGDFQGTADFDPDPKASSDPKESTAVDASDGFVVYLDPTGAYRWHRVFGGKGNDAATAVGMRRTTGEVWFGGTTAQGAVLERWPGDGSAAVWAALFANDAGANRVEALVVDAAGTVYATGSFAGSVDFDPNGPGAPLTGSSASSFVVGFRLPGESLFASAIDGIATVDLALLDTTVLVTGQFQGVVDFDPGTEVYEVTAANGLPSAFTLGLTTAGALSWVGVHESDTALTNGTAIAVTTDRIFAAGEAATDGTIDIDPAATRVPFVVPNAEVGMFLSKLDETGTVVP